MKKDTSNPIFTLAGRLKFLSVDAGGIHISYNKLMLKGERTIPFSHVVSVEVKKPGLTNGYIYFQTAASAQKRQTNVNDIALDDNSVFFLGKEKYNTALEIQQYVEQWQAPTTTPQAPSAADEILKYKQLLDGGAITPEEFEAKKKQLLGL